jgi:hypothetical protein
MRPVLIRMAFDPKSRDHPDAHGPAASRMACFLSASLLGSPDTNHGNKVHAPLVE